MRRQADPAAGRCISFWEARAIFRKLLGSVLGTGIFVLGFYLWFTLREEMEPQAALVEAAKRGAAYLIAYTALSHLLTK